MQPIQCLTKPRSRKNAMPLRITHHTKPVKNLPPAALAMGLNGDIHRKIAPLRLGDAKFSF